MSGRWFKCPEAILFSRQHQRCPATVFRTWVSLLALASWSGGALPADRQDLAFMLHISPAALARRIGQLQEAGLVAIGGDGEVMILGVVETGDRAHDDRPAPLTAAERTRRWRESRRERDARDEAGDDAVTAVTPIEEDKMREESQIARGARGERDEAFEKFWSAYPSREGDNPRQPAEAAFRRAVTAGADPEALIEGARRYSAAVAGREGRYIASAVRWITERRWEGSKPVTTSAPAAEASGHWISADSDAGRAWAAFWRETKGRTPPVDARGGWRFPAPLPPVAMAEVAA